MYKLLIADDEAWIRKGLRNSINWNELNIEIIGEAEDGELALELAKKLNPNIILVDINMPFLNGLDLIKEIKKIDENCLIIIITGYDEFSFMHEAIKLKVFDYLLKPVKRDNLKEIILKAVNELLKIQGERDYFNWANKQLDENIGSLKQTFMNNWLNGQLEYTQIINELNFLKIMFQDDIGMLIIKVVERLNIQVSSKNWDSKELNFAILNISSELIEKYKPLITYIDERNNIVIISNIKILSEWLNLSKSIEESVFKYLHYVVEAEQKKIKNGIFGVKGTYEEILNDISIKEGYKPVVFLAIKYINDNYFVSGLKLEDVALKFNVTQSYISKLLKQETGLSFIDYLTNIRIKKAICIMEDPTVKIYQIAELVGYSNQHYFCKAFKKAMGVSPTEYREGVSN